MLAFLASGYGKWISGGLIAAVIAGSLFLWHRAEYVPRAELEQWKEYTSNLAKAYSKREQIIQKYEEEKRADDAIIEQMVEELENARVKEAEGDDPVVLSDDDAKRLLDFLRKR